MARGFGPSFLVASVQHILVRRRVVRSYTCIHVLTTSPSQVSYNCYGHRGPETETGFGEVGAGLVTASRPVFANAFLSSCRVIPCPLSCLNASRGTGAQGSVADYTNK